MGGVVLYVQSGLQSPTLFRPIAFIVEDRLDRLVSEVQGCLLMSPHPDIPGLRIAPGTHN